MYSHSLGLSPFFEPELADLADRADVLSSLDYKDRLYAHLKSDPRTKFWCFMVVFEVLGSSKARSSCSASVEHAPEIPTLCKRANTQIEQV